ncbi:GNAT family N-acetyltransferase [Streptomyces sp. NBC_00893]|uniref:GNAT family N-acetyltransferase n=1 Tax=Streptomyces sp. NBC_00893 TaxID=2975862 RepID=UPI0022598956|nr:GNAT family N-acetyltransferase [Streptomyces sp. NBC_00893]MCX4850270.1 GNAT family N-acetyltransferase [Streptomyces sp. NBC_00893]
MPVSEPPVGMPPCPEPRTELVVTDSPTPEDIAVISGALDRFNIERTGIDDRTPLAVLIRDPETHQVIGGLTGRTSLGLFFVDLFFLPPGLRGSGLGGEILRQAEKEARARGCRAAVLYTITFQAPCFYRKQGWRLLGEVPCDPPGAGRIFMTKELAAETGSI